MTGQRKRLIPCCTDAKELQYRFATSQVAKCLGSP